MLRNFVTVALRNITRQKGYAFINVFGLAVGLAAFILISLFIEHELSIDAHIPDGDRIYRVELDAAVGGQEIHTVSSPAVMAGAFMDAFPEIESAVRVDDWSRALISRGEEGYYEPEFFLADSTVFDFFDIELLQGDPRTALNRPNTVVLSEDAAIRLFGDSDPMGEIIQLDNDDDLEVTGVFRMPTERTHFRPEIIGSFLTHSQADSPIWLNNSFVTYIRLRADADPAALEAKFPEYQREQMSSEVEQFMGVTLEEARANGLKYDWILQSMPEIYLYSNASDDFAQTGDIRYVYILGVIALFVLAIACINFMNLATARAGRRAREVGLRKVLGADRGGLIRQFLAESTTIAVLAMVVAIILVAALMPAFESIAGVSLSVGPGLIALVLGVTLATGLLAGAYPAFFLSGFQPATVLKGAFKAGRSGRLIRSGLVVFQFAISITLLVGTLVVTKQLDYMRSKDLGFDKEQVIILPIESQEALESFGVFRDELRSNPNVVDAATGNALPGPDHIHQTTVFRGEGMREDETFVAVQANVGDDYVETLGLRLVAGRDFGPEFPGDSLSFVINESAAAEMGFSAEEAVGKRITHFGGGPDDGDRTATVVGVLQDAHYESLHSKVMPIILSNQDFWQRYAVVKMRTEDVSGTLASIGRSWAAFQPDVPFQYTFMDEEYDRFYAQERRLGVIYSSFATLAIIIACLGLFGLASFVTSQRRKEIGVRKVLGASVPSVVALLSREFTVLVLVSCAVAFPVSWFTMNRWLEDFAYATTIGWSVFVISGSSALVIAWLTVSWQSIRAATANPVDALRTE